MPPCEAVPRAHSAAIDTDLEVLKGAPGLKYLKLPLKYGGVVTILIGLFMAVLILLCNQVLFESKILINYVRRYYVTK